jgi:hypothetical protein
MDNPIYGVTGGLASETAGPTRTAELIAGLNLDWATINAAWEDLEPTKGTYTCGWLRERIEKLHRVSPQTQVMLRLSPRCQWASGVLTDPNLPYLAHPPLDLSEYANMVETVLREVGPLLWAVQFGNEQESLHWWSGSVDEYLVLLRVSYGATKRYCRSMPVVMGGFTSASISAAALHEEGWPDEDIREELGIEDPSWPSAGFSWESWRAGDFMERCLQEGDYDIADGHFYHRTYTMKLRANWLKKQLPVVCSTDGIRNRRS